MGRKCTGLRNRKRDGKGTYSLKRKSRVRDRYGKFENGHRLTPDVLTKWETPEGKAA